MFNFLYSLSERVLRARLDSIVTLYEFAAMMYFLTLSGNLKNDVTCVSLSLLFVFLLRFFAISPNRKRKKRKKRKKIKKKNKAKLQKAKLKT